MPNDDRPKRSWRDIDKMRNGSSSRGPSTSRQEPQQDRAQKQYRAALEALFETGEIGKIADKLPPSPGRSQVSSSDEPPEPREPRDDDPTANSAIVAAEAAAGEAERASTAKEPPSKKKPLDDRLAMRKKVVEATGRHEITKTAEKFLEKFPLPDDHEFLEQLLEHEQETRTQEAMTRIAQLLDRNQPPRRSRALCGKLRYLSETSGNEDLQVQAQGLLKRLG